MRIHFNRPKMHKMRGSHLQATLVPPFLIHLVKAHYKPTIPAVPGNLQREYHHQVPAKLQREVHEGVAELTKASDLKCSQSQAQHHVCDN